MLLLAGHCVSYEGHDGLNYQHQHAGASPLPDHDAHATYRGPREGGKPFDVVREPSARKPEHWLLAVPHGKKPLEAAGRNKTGGGQVAIELCAGGVV